MKLTKIDVARRQLNQAIILHFQRGDPVSIHTLTGAADQIVCDIANKRGHILGLDQMNDEAIKRGYLGREMLAEIERFQRAPRNYFKHADKDPGELLEFNPEINHFQMWITCEHFAELSPELGPVNIFRLWFPFKYAHIWRKCDNIREKIEKMESEGVNAEDYEVFLRLCNDYC